MNFSSVYVDVDLNKHTYKHTIFHERWASRARTMYVSLAQQGSLKGHTITLVPVDHTVNSLMFTRDLFGEFRDHL